MILSYKQINDIAQEIISSYCGDVFAPVNIEGLLKDKLGILIEYYNIASSWNDTGYVFKSASDY